MCPQGAGPLLLPVLPSQAAGPNSASAGKRWEQTSELQQGVYWSRDVYCIQNLADPLFLWLYPVAVGFAFPFGEGEAVQPFCLGTTLLRLMQCTCTVCNSIRRPPSLSGASSDRSRPGAGMASGFTSCLFDLAPQFPSCMGGILQAVRISGDGGCMGRIHVLISKASGGCAAGVAGLQPLEHLRWVQAHKPSLPGGPVLLACCWSPSWQ